MPKPIAKSRRADAERAAEHFLVEYCQCVAVRRAVRTQFQSVDFFAADVMGKDRNGSLIIAQATAGGDEALRQRRRKLEAFPWAQRDRVFVLQLTERPHPVSRQRKQWFFRVHELEGDYPDRNKWRLWGDAVEVPKEWFKAYKHNVNPRITGDGVQETDGKVQANVG